MSDRLVCWLAMLLVCVLWGTSGAVPAAVAQEKAGEDESRATEVDQADIQYFLERAKLVRALTRQYRLGDKKHEKATEPTDEETSLFTDPLPFEIDRLPDAAEAAQSPRAVHAIIERRISSIIAFKNRVARAATAELLSEQIGHEISRRKAELRESETGVRRQVTRRIRVNVDAALSHQFRSFGSHGQAPKGGFLEQGHREALVGRSDRGVFFVAAGYQTSDAPPGRSAGDGQDRQRQSAWEQLREMARGSSWDSRSISSAIRAEVAAALRIADEPVESITEHDESFIGSPFFEGEWLPQSMDSSQESSGTYPSPAPARYQTLRIREDIPLPGAVERPEGRPHEEIIPKGVKILIDDAMLAKVLNEQGTLAALREIEQLEEALLGATDEGQIYRQLEEYTAAKKSAFLESTCEFRDIQPVRLVSLKTLVDKLTDFRDRPNERSDALKTVGGLTRIHGFLRNPQNEDLLLIGVANPEDPAIHLDHLIVGLRSVWRDGFTPTCSLDPSPSDFSGPQHARISGVPRDSAFARIMLDADYAMKKILFRAEGERLDIPGLRDLDNIFDRSAGGRTSSRYWLFPIQPGRNEIQLGPFGSYVLFDARVQTLTEAMTLSGDGMSGTGKTHPSAERDARIFTQHYDQIAVERPIFKKLRGLFDIVLLGRIVRLTAPEEPLFVALLEHEHEVVDVPDSYPGVTVHHTRGEQRVVISGGCRIQPRAGVRAMIESPVVGQNALTTAATEMARQGKLYQDVGEGIALPQLVADWGGPQELAYTQGRRLFAEGKHADACEQFSAAITADDLYTAAYALRSAARFELGRFRGAIDDAFRAVMLEPQDASRRASFYRLGLEMEIPDVNTSIDTFAARELATWYTTRGRARMASDEFKEAIADFDKAILLNKEAVFAYGFRGFTRHHLKDFDNAIADLSVAIRLDPRPTVYGPRALAWHAKGEFDRALADFDEAIKLDPTLPASYAGRGMSWYEKGDYDKALSDWNTLVRLDPRSPQSFDLRGKALTQQNEYARALADFDEALRLDPEYASAYCNRGTAWNEQGDHKAALADYSEAIRIDSKQTQAYLGRGVVWQQQGEHQKAIADFDQVIQLDDYKPGAAYAGRGLSWKQTGEFGKAISDLNVAIRLDPESRRAVQPMLAGAHFDRAKAFLKTDVDRAMEDFDEAVRLNPKHGELYAGRGMAWVLKQDDDKAIADLTTALRFDPELPDLPPLLARVHHRRGVQRYRNRDVDSAIADFDESVRLDPKSSDTYYDRGNAWKQKGELDKAISDYDEALRLSPDSAKILNNRGMVWSQKGDPQKAIADFSESIRLAPKNVIVYRNRGMAWSQMGELDKAIADYTEAIRVEPRFYYAYNDRGRAWKQKGDLDKAIADYTEALRLSPRFHYAYTNRGVAWHGKRNYDQAIADLSEAIRLSSKNVMAYYNRGHAWRQKGSLDKAIADYDEVIRIAPEYRFAYNSRGLAWKQKGDYDKAVADFTASIELAPSSWTHTNRAFVWKRKGQYAKALEDYDKAIALNPKYGDAYTSRAWLLATCPDAQVRDGRKAVQSATKACELTNWKEGNDLENLAAAYAESGDFERAIEWQTKALSAPNAPFDKSAAEERLELYKAGKPYREK